MINTSPEAIEALLRTAIEDVEQAGVVIKWQRAELAAQRSYKDAAYLERNKLVALLAAIFPSGTKRTTIEGWSEDWHGCVYIDFPWGQASWHYHDSQAGLFAHLPPYAGEWDGHDTNAKYAAIVSASRHQLTSTVDVHLADTRAELAAIRARETVLVEALEYCAREDGTHPENRKTVARDALQKRAALAQVTP